MRKYLYFTVFVAGMTTMAAEFGASRLLGNVFGTSNLVWAAIIGLILIYLTAGYFLGGRWADRSPHAETMYVLLAWAAFSLGIIPFIASPVLRAAADAFDTMRMGVLGGAFAGVLILFTIPITLLGCISPFAIRISMQDSSRAGHVAGTIYGISTIGSFLGTFLPTLVLIPVIGTLRTFLVFSLLLLCVALVGMAKSAGWRKMLPYLLMVLILIVLGILGGRADIKSSQGQIYESESAYNYIQVLEINGHRYLRLNEGQGVHSEYAPDTFSYGGPWQQFLVGPFFNPAKNVEDVGRVAVVGLAAGTTARQADEIFPNVIIDGWEIDPQIVEIGRTYFDMNLPNLNVFVMDGRWGLEQSSELYDLIIVDAYRPPYIPPHLTTQEFFQVAADHLKPDGILAINIGRAPGDRRLIDGLATTIGSILPSIHVMDIPGTFNSILYASRMPTEAADLQANFERLLGEEESPVLLLESMYLTLQNLQPAPEVTVVFTDDRSPIEWLTNNLILNYIFEGNLSEIQ